MTQHLYWTPKPKGAKRLPDILRDEFRGNNSWRVSDINFLTGVWAALRGEEKAEVEVLLKFLEEGGEVILEID